MIVARHLSSEQSHWSLGKIDQPSHNPASPRMSNHFAASIPTQPDWQGQYSYLPQGEGNAFSQVYDQKQEHNHVSPGSSQPRSVTARGQGQPDLQAKDDAGSESSRRRSLDHLGTRQARRPSPIPEQDEVHGDGYTVKTSEPPSHDEPRLSTGPPSLSVGSNPLSSVSSAGQASELLPTPTDESTTQHKDDEDEDDDLVDDEMLDCDPEQLGRPQTAAERAAARRKMKRFRYVATSPVLNCITRQILTAEQKQTHAPANSIPDE
jgi:hypothetical protein